MLQTKETAIKIFNNRPSARYIDARCRCHGRPGRNVILLYSPTFTVTSVDLSDGSILFSFEAKPDVAFRDTGRAELKEMQLSGILWRGGAIRFLSVDIDDATSNGSTRERRWTREQLSEMKVCCL